MSRATRPGNNRDCGPVAIRPARTSDAAAIVELVRALAAHIDDAALATVTPGQLAAAGEGAQPLWRGVVAEMTGERRGAPAGRLAGVCLYSVLFSTWVGAPGLHVIDLYVRPESRGGRLGTRLLAAAARQGQAQGCRFIRLEVDARNAGAEEFYGALGFEKRSGDRIFTLRGQGYAALVEAASDPGH